MCQGDASVLRVLNENEDVYRIFEWQISFIDIFVFMMFIGIQTSIRLDKCELINTN